MAAAQSKQAQRAAEIRVKFREDCDRVRANRQLAPLGVAQQLSALHAQAKSEITRLRQAEADALQTRRSELADGLFGSERGLRGSDKLSWRDAVDRADQPKKESEALTMLNRALRHGDDELAVALARRAEDAGWSAVFETWADVRRVRYPQLDDVVSELLQIDISLAPGADSHQILNFSTPMTPAELGNYSKEQLAGPDAQPAVIETLIGDDAGAMVR